MAAGRPEALGSGRPTRTECGAVAVEFALVLPVLVILLLGITTSGISYSHAIGATNAVREGSRFGATADAGVPATWAADVIKRVRGTQFDDPTSETAVCVQLWKKGSGSLAGSCSQGTVQPNLTLPTTETASPAVPAGLATGACVVRVIAARNFTINIAVAPAWNRVNVATSVARYERTDKVASCG